MTSVYSKNNVLETQNCIISFSNLFLNCSLFFRLYYAEDDDYKYKIAICQINHLESNAVQQMGKKWKPDTPWLPVGTYDKAQVAGGSK